MGEPQLETTVEPQVGHHVVAHRDRSTDMRTEPSQGPAHLRDGEESVRTDPPEPRQDIEEYQDGKLRESQVGRGWRTHLRKS